MSKLIQFFQRYIPRTILIRMSYVFMWFLDIYYRGSRYKSPINQKGYRKFLPYGAHAQRENALCPGDLSLERHRLLWLYLEEKTDFFEAPKRMLHVAPEQCYHKRFKKMLNLDYVTADLNSPIADIKMDLHDIPLEDNSFDVIFCNHVMEHVDDDIRCMSELQRVLKPGGFAIMQVPQDVHNANTLEDKSITDPKERERLYWQKDHVRLYGLDYPKRLREAGFIVKEDDFVKHLPKEVVDKYRLPTNEIIYYSTKS